jgi:hypothetical protein
VWSVRLNSYFARSRPSGYHMHSVAYLAPLKVCSRVSYMSMPFVMDCFKRKPVQQSPLSLPPRKTEPVVLVSTLSGLWRP